VERVSYLKVAVDEAQGQLRKPEEGECQCLLLEAVTRRLVKTMAEDMYVCAWCMRAYIYIYIYIYLYLFIYL
jgi:hypothetical protein